jgi:hypothetical protein
MRITALWNFETVLDAPIRIKGEEPMSGLAWWEEGDLEASALGEGCLIGDVQASLR